MDEKNEINYLFASCEIKWEIENFCFAYPRNKCSILSPTFMLQGLKHVYWRMSMELQDVEIPEIEDMEVSPEESAIEVSPEESAIEVSPEESAIEVSPEETAIEMSPEKTDIKKSPEDGMVSVFVEMLPTSKAKSIFANWEMTLTVDGKVFGPYETKFDFVEPSKHGHIGIATTKEILDVLTELKHDTITIRFYFIAFEKGSFSIPKDEKPPGIFHLYKDFKRFKDMEENFSDIKLKVSDQYIKAHKIVLSCNERFDIYIKQAVDDVVEMSHFDYKTLDAFVNYLYSGEIIDCLEVLSISMMRCMGHFNSDALKPYYIPEELPLNSKIQIKKMEYQWYVPDILDKDEFEITSLPITFLNSSTMWHLCISMKANDPKKFISIFAEITAGEKPKYLCLEFALINKSGREFCRKSLLRLNECYEDLGFEEFLTRKYVCENRFTMTMGDCVGFMFRIKTSIGSQESSIGCHAMSFILPSKSKPHKQMSQKMLDFLKNEIYSDVLMVSSNNSKVNKFILAARSPGLKENIENNGNIIYVCGVEPRYMRAILKYMYTGLLEESAETILELSKLSLPEKLDIPSLLAECEQYLKEKNACYNVKRKY